MALQAKFNIGKTKLTKEQKEEILRISHRYTSSELAKDLIAAVELNTTNRSENKKAVNSFDSTSKN